MISRGRACQLVTGGLLLVLVSTPALAEGRRYGKAFIEKFKLNQDQVTQLEHMRNVREAGREKERVVRHEINRIVYANELDQTALNRLADQLAALVKSNLTADAALAHEFYLTLNADQRARWAAHETRDTQRTRRGQREEGEPSRNQLASPTPP